MCPVPKSCDDLDDDADENSQVGIPFSVLVVKLFKLHGLIYISPYLHQLR